jgi:hypothetical protein
MAILDQSVNLTGEQIDAGQQADRAITLIFMIAREGRMDTGLGRHRVNPPRRIGFMESMNSSAKIAKPSTSGQLRHIKSGNDQFR